MNKIDKHNYVYQGKLVSFDICILFTSVSTDIVRNIILKFGKLRTILCRTVREMLLNFFLNTLGISHSIPVFLKVDNNAPLWALEDFRGR